MWCCSGKAAIASVQHPVAPKQPPIVSKECAPGAESSVLGILSPVQKSQARSDILPAGSNPGNLRDDIPSSYVPPSRADCGQQLDGPNQVTRMVPQVATTTVSTSLNTTSPRVTGDALRAPVSIAGVASRVHDDGLRESAVPATESPSVQGAENQTGVATPLMSPRSDISMTGTSAAAPGDTAPVPETAAPAMSPHVVDANAGTEHALASSPPSAPHSPSSLLSSTARLSATQQQDLDAIGSTPSSPQESGAPSTSLPVEVAAAIPELPAASQEFLVAPAATSAPLQSMQAASAPATASPPGPVVPSNSGPVQADDAPVVVNALSAPPPPSPPSLPIFSARSLAAMLQAAGVATSGVPLPSPRSPRDVGVIPLTTLLPTSSPRTAPASAVMGPSSPLSRLRPLSPLVPSHEAVEIPSPAAASATAAPPAQVVEQVCTWQWSLFYVMLRLKLVFMCCDHVPCRTRL
jgi:hypothetical protein